MSNHKLLTQAVLLSCSVFSFGTFAVSNGVSVSRSSYQHYVDMNCSGSLISGKWVLTAAHCSRDNGLVPVRIHDGSYINTVAQYEHADYEYRGVDIGVWELADLAKVASTALISMDEMVSGELITLFGFGGSAPDLSYAVQSVREASDSGSFSVITDYIGQGASLPGDSGGAYVDQNGFVRAVHYGTYDGGISMIGTRVTNAKDLLLEHVNGWNYPTALDFTGQYNVSVQSLHKFNTVDQAYTEGDVTLDIENSTCVTELSISPFDVCTYSVKSNGGEGKLYLSGHEVIEVNSVANTNDKDDGNNHGGGGSSGASFGLVSLFGAAIVAFIRRKSEKV